MKSMEGLSSLRYRKLDESGPLLESQSLMRQSKPFGEGQDPNYMTAIKRLIDKYEILFNDYDTYKGEMTEKLNHYISLNNSLYAKNSELGVTVKQKNDSINKLMRENLSLSSELGVLKQSNDKITEHLNEVRALLGLNEKFSENLRKLCSQKEAEAHKWKNEYYTMEKSLQESLSRCLREKEGALEKARVVEEAYEVLRQENLLIIDEMSKNQNDLQRKLTETQHALAESDANLFNARHANEELSREAQLKEAAFLGSEEARRALSKDYQKLQEEAQRRFGGEYTFEGTLVNGKKENIGVLRCPTFTYHGEFRGDRMCGQGVRTYNAPFKILEGEFNEEELFVGRRIQFQNFTYVGEVVGDMAEGKGYLEVGKEYIVEGYFAKDQVEEGKSLLVTDLSTGCEYEVCLNQDLGLLIGAQEDVRFCLDFEKGVFKKSD